MNSKTFSWQQVYFAFFMYALVLVMYGYTVGTGDQAEFLPYAKYIHNPTLYPHDLYIQGSEARHINERFFFARLMALFVPVLEPATFIFHLFFTVLFVLGVLRFSSHYIENRFLRYAAVFFILIVTNGMTVGGNELYYNNFQGASIAKALCAWGLSFLVERRYILLSLFTITSTLFQPMVGFHFFILTSVVIAYNIIIDKKEKPLTLLWYVLAFAFTGGLFIAGIKATQGREVLATITDREFIDAAYYFGMPFHFVPSYFSKKAILLFIPLFIAAIYFYSKKEKSIMVLLLTILAGMVVYVAGTYLYESILIMNSWWFRTSVWIKLTGFVAVMALIGTYFKITEYTKYRVQEKWFFVLATVLLVIGIVKFPDSLPGGTYHLLGHSSHYPDVEICEQVKDKVPNDAVFIQPMSFSTVKYYAEKSSYVEFLTPIPTGRDYLKIWYTRVGEVYNLSIANIPENTCMLKAVQIRENLVKMAEENYRKHTKESLMKLKAKGVTHMITYKDHTIEGLKVIAKNKEFKVYEL